MRLILIVCLLIISLNLAPAQNIPSNYKLLKTIEHPHDLKIPAIYEIYIDTIADVIAVSYYDEIYIYNLSRWSLIGHVTIKFTMLDHSFTDYTSNNVYFYESNKSYSTYNLSTKILTTYKLKKNENVPNEFYRNDYIESKDSYYNDLVIMNKEWYILKNTPKQGAIYLKQ